MVPDYNPLDDDLIMLRAGEWLSDVSGEVYRGNMSQDDAYREADAVLNAAEEIAGCPSVLWRRASSLVWGFNVACIYADECRHRREHPEYFNPGMRR